MTTRHSNFVANATIIRTDAGMPIWIIQSPNPETLLAKWIREFLVEIRFAEMYPKQGQVRIGNIHPFAMLLLQEVQSGEVKFNASLFPSITIADTTENEEFPTLGRETEIIKLNDVNFTAFEAYKRRGEIIVSDQAMTYLQAAIAAGSVFAVQTGYIGSHQLDLNIWSENKTVTGVLFDMLKAFLNSRRGDLHQLGIDVIGNLSGRRSGDISVEFGSLLHGANLTVPTVIRASALRVEILWDTIETVVNAPTYHTGGE